jgi:hypothetical protein
MQVMPVQKKKNAETSPAVTYSISFKVETTFCPTCFYMELLIISKSNLLTTLENSVLNNLSESIGHENDTEKME